MNAMTKTPSLDKFTVRRWRPEDVPGLVDCYRASYKNEALMEKKDDVRLFKMELAKFPEGQFLVETNGKIVAYACSIIVQLDDEQPYYKYTEITGDGTFSTHTPSGDTLYGADIAVHPDYRGRGLSELLYQHRMKLLKRYNLRRMVAHGRLSGYAPFAGKLTPQEYVTKVEKRQLKDPALTAHLKAGYKVKTILIDHTSDRESLNCATWLEMQNLDFDETKRRIAATPIRRPVRRVRVCAAQYEMKQLDSWEDFERNLRFFADTASSYHSHFLVFPELFTINLFVTLHREMGNLEAIQCLAQMTPRYIASMTKLAVERGMYIIGGSHPTLRDGLTYNTAYLFTPSGAHYTQDKLHITPGERETFGITPGTHIKIFDTSFARIAIPVCYDIEFPELGRILADYGAEILFVPFSTDERKAYNRVRFTAQSRAVENCVYVVLAGNVGNLPNLTSYLINYGQSAIITPSDFGFPVGAVEAEADPNTETVAVADLDITQLLLQREIGSVRPYFERRRDLYETIAKVPVEIIRCE